MGSNTKMLQQSDVIDWGQGGPVIDDGDHSEAAGPTQPGQGTEPSRQKGQSLHMP